jgi:hypothetical protein
MYYIYITCVESGHPVQSQHVEAEAEVLRDWPSASVKADELRDDLPDNTENMARQHHSGKPAPKEKRKSIKSFLHPWLYLSKKKLKIILYV